MQCTSESKLSDMELTHGLLVANRTLAIDRERVLSALWRKLAAETLMQQLLTALFNVQKLQNLFDGT